VSDDDLPAETWSRQIGESEHAELGLASGIPCRLHNLDAMAAAKTWHPYLKNARLRRVSAQDCSGGPFFKKTMTTMVQIEFRESCCHPRNRQRHIGIARPGNHPIGTLTVDRDSRSASRVFNLWFAEERDRMYVVFTVIVFSILFYSLVGSA